jgi:hypothetical protein
MSYRDYFDRDRERNWDREDRERWERDRSGDWGPHQRGASGSEGGYGFEESYGSSRGLTQRGGGTGYRDNEDWNFRNRERGRGFGSSFANSGYGSGWGGGMSGFSGSLGTYADRGTQPERGRFTGRGPKNWRRSDERIRDDINERLTMHPDIDATEIDVQVKDGEVTLMGTVDERYAKRLAEDLAENTSGVRDVHNQIRVQRWDDYDRTRNREGFQTTTGNNPQPSSQQQHQYAGSTRSGR